MKLPSMFGGPKEMYEALKCFQVSVILAKATLLLALLCLPEGSVEAIIIGVDWGFREGSLSVMSTYEDALWFPNANSI